MCWSLVFALCISIMEASIATPAFLLQQPPNLAGHWVLDPPPGPSGVDGPVCGHECDITQAARVLTVIIRGRPAQTYRLDGSPATTTDTMGNYCSQTTVTARWDGTILVITRQTGPVGGSPTIETTTRLSLNNGCLVIDNKGRINGQPYSGRGGGKPFVYRPAK